jgi:hypothetical protein
MMTAVKHHHHYALLAFKGHTPHSWGILTKTFGKINSTKQLSQQQLACKWVVIRLYPDDFDLIQT